MRAPASTTVELLVEEAMHRGVIACARDASLTDVARLMAENRVHAIIVRDEGRDGARLWGVVSDLDLVAAAGVRDLDEQTAGASAASPVLRVSPRESLWRAAQLMTEHSSTHLVVVDPDTRRPVGVLSTLDIARALVRNGREIP